MDGRLSLDELSSLAETGEVDTVTAAVADLRGRLRCERVPVRHFLSPGHKGGLVPSAYLAADPEGAPDSGNGDLATRPDLATLRRAAWEPGTALVLCDVLDPLGRAPLPQAPRQVLKRQLARARELGFDVLAGSSVEFTMFEADAADLRRGGYRNLSGLVAAGEDGPLLRRLSCALLASGVPVEGVRSSDGLGRLGLRAGPALEAADHHVLARHAVKAAGAKAGHAIGFHPQWHAERAGAASPVRVSLLAGRDPAFFDTSLPHGMSRLMRAFTGGLIRGLEDCAVLLAPHVNSYKRFKGSAAPTRNAWSLGGRNTAFRLLGKGTSAIALECAVPGADANPYLVLAALLAAGLDGIAQRLDCGDPASGDAPAGRGAEVPRNLREAVLALRGSAMLRAAMGDAVVDHYVRAAEAELAAFDRAVTDWEIARGFDCL